MATSGAEIMKPSKYFGVGFAIPPLNKMRCKYIIYNLAVVNHIK